MREHRRELEIMMKTKEILIEIEIESHCKSWLWILVEEAFTIDYQRKPQCYTIWSKFWTFLSYTDRMVQQRPLDPWVTLGGLVEF